MQSAQLLVEKMKTDHAFRVQILGEPVIENRFSRLKAAGFDCNPDDIARLQSSFELSEKGEDLAHTWQNGGPCHTKCAPVLG
jgi:predicted ribosomally synthesized peptide with nif11-like leader